MVAGPTDKMGLPLFRRGNPQVMIGALPGFWLGVVLVCLLLMTAEFQDAHAQARQLSATTASEPTDKASAPDASDGPLQAQPTPDTAAEEEAALQEEVGDRDLTYLRTRVVYRYDYKYQAGDTTTNRLRFKLLYAFGPHQRFGASVMVPILQKSKPTASATGSGDTEVVVGANLYYTEGFRTGVSYQLTFQTSSDSLLGGATTTMKPAWGFNAVFSKRFSLTAAFYYKQSIHTTRGTPVRQFEPDITFNTRVRKATWYVEWDSFYDFTPAQLAQTLKTGVSRRLGAEHQWVVAAYCGFPLNAYGRQTQYYINPGIDVTWYPFKNK